MELPLATIERIMKNAGAERLSEDAVDRMRDSAQALAEELASDAVAIASEEGRDSVTRDDIRRAVER